MAVSYDTWAELQTAVEAWTSIDVSDAQVQEFIGLAESHFQRTLFNPDRETAFTLATTGTVALPTDFNGFKSGPYLDDATDVVLTRLTPGDFRSTYPDATTGTPSHYMIEDENIVVGPTPSASVNLKGTYYAAIVPLSGSATSNWLLLEHPDLYLAGSLAEAFTFHMDEQRAALWARKRDDIIAAINKVGIRRATNSGPLVASHSIANVRNIQA